MWERKKSSWKSWLVFFGKMLFWSVFFGVFVSIFWQGWEMQRRISGLNDEKKMMANHIASLQKDQFENCQSQNLIKKKLQMLEDDCSAFLNEGTENFHRSLTEEFLEMFRSLVLEEDFSPENQLLLAKSFPAKLPDSEFSQKDFVELFEQEFLQKYLQSLGFELQKGVDFAEIILTKNKNPVAKLIWREDKKQAFWVQIASKSIFPFQGFWEQKNKMENEIFLAEQEKFLEELEKNSGDMGKKSENFLFLGSNEKNTDTIILARVFHSEKKILLFSVPRDLWVEGRKINAWQRTFGQEIFVQKMESLLGQQISGVVEVSMEAFPLMVDALGGISFVFEKPLLDPTYKTVDDGKMGTLFFEAGTHHLSGIQALRVARSRHTTSDFSRAERQQKLLLAMAEEIKKNRSFSAFSRLGNIVFHHLETSLSLSQMLSLAWNAKEYSIVTTPSMSTKNVLQSEMLDLGRGQKAYILEPKNNNWTLLRSFVVQCEEKCF